MSFDYASIHIFNNFGFIRYNFRVDPLYKKEVHYYEIDYHNKYFVKLIDFHCIFLFKSSFPDKNKRILNNIFYVLFIVYHF